MGITYVYDDPSTPSTESEHWKSLNHQKGDRLIASLEELKTEFRTAIDTVTNSSTGTTAVGGGTSTSCSNNNDQAKESDDKKKSSATLLALWSCLLGYCEALTTHKDPRRRFQLYPIPIDGLSRLVQVDFFHSLKQHVASIQPTNHRAAAQVVSNCIWSRVASKANAKDELHANSLYIALRGKALENKSLDCFGAALCTVIGLKCVGYHMSMLTLSEDHAYESHVNDETQDQQLATCEVAIPGNTKASQMKRGREVRETFSQKAQNGNKTPLTPETSWLYMGKCPVLCHSIPMTLAAQVANMNCTIETNNKSSQKKSQQREVSSEPLLNMKRELLWILKDGGHLATFPFAMIELGDCEEHQTSPRGEEWACRQELGDCQITAMEALYHEAIQVCRVKYNNGQVYPYCYAGHYHKDGGNEGPDEEYRLVEALRCYSEASRVASHYVYEWGDSLQLTKVMVKLANVIMNDILLKGESPRLWNSRENQVAAGTWLVAFFDALLSWEEQSGGIHFLPILKPNHPNGIGKMFSVLVQDVRHEVLAKMTVSNDSNNSNVNAQSSFSKPIMSNQDLYHFTTPTSKRLAPNGLLYKALTGTKVSIGDMELAIVDREDESDNGRRSKRRRRGGK